MKPAVEIWLTLFSTITLVSSSYNKNPQGRSDHLPLYKSFIFPTKVTTSDLMMGASMDAARLGYASLLY